jgi:hypothetical protein
MKPMYIALAALVAGCASTAPPAVQERAAEVRARTAAMDMRVSQIIDAKGADVPGHPQYATLGSVEGYCEQTPEGNGQTIAGDSLKESAVRKYGDRVNAIVNESAFYVSNSATGGAGYWQCTGTAVSFATTQ